MISTRKPSQKKEVQLSGSFAAVPAASGPEMAQWFAQLQNALKEDRKTIEDAFAKLKAEITTLSLSLSAQVSALVTRVEALEGAPGFQMPLIRDQHVAADAAIKEAKLALNFKTHPNVNDPTPAQKQALNGTAGAPGASNRYVTDSDPRLLPATPLTPTELEFTTPAATWNWNHGLGYKPMVEVFNSNGEKMVAYVQHVDEDNLVVEHTYNATGLVRILP